MDVEPEGYFHADLDDAFFPNSFVGKYIPKPWDLVGHVQKVRHQIAWFSVFSRLIYSARARKVVPVRLQSFDRRFVYEETQ